MAPINIPTMNSKQNIEHWNIDQKYKHVYNV